jgi:high-affinity nickel-transport protein
MSGLAVMIFLGMRHALDPDHVATVDGMAFGLIDRSPALAPWVGSLFALGHGAVVTAIAMGAGALGTRLTPSGAAATVIEWSPVALLLVVGSMNLAALLRTEEFRPVGLKSRFLPRGLRENTHPAVILFVGVLFALALDSIVQAATWGYAAAQAGGVGAAGLVGTVFTAGMVVTATLYGHVVCRVLTTAAASDNARRIRRAIGWFTVALAYGVAACAMASAMWPALGLEEAASTLLGLPMVVAMVGVWGLLRWRARRPAVGAVAVLETTVPALPVEPAAPSVRRMSTLADAGRACR